MDLYCLKKCLRSLALNRIPLFEDSVPIDKEIEDVYLMIHYVDVDRFSSTCMRHYPGDRV